MLWDESADDLILAGAGGLVVAGNVDFNGDLDVDGTTNLDVVDIDGAVDMASTLAVAGAVTASSTLTAQKLVSTNGVLELDDNGSHNGVINSPASLFINIDSDGTSTGEDFVISKDRTGVSGGTELFRVQEDGFVGIGGSPVEKLYVNSTSGDARIGLNAPSGSDTEIKFFNNGSVNYTIGHDDATDNFVIGTANVDTPLLSVTKAGDVLVGKSALAFATAGTEIMDHGEIQVTRASGVPMYLRRNSSDGDILSFYKDGTNVGSIGNNGDNLGIESVDVGLLFLSGSSQIVPTGGNFGVSDGTKDLGRSNTRFKDLYLSNNISLSNATTSAFLQVSSNILQFGTSSNDPLAFYTNNAEAMRILADGSVAQGNTVSLVASNYSNQAGAAWHEPDGHYEIATTGNRSALEIGKNNASDGSLVVFRKQSTVVGTIGTANADSITIGNGTGNLILYAGTVAPCSSSSGGASNGAVDLGASGRRFKDLYLSGGVQNVTDSGVATGTLISAITGVTNGFQISANTSNEMTYDFNTGAGLKMRLTNDGKLGIGTSVPDSPLEIQAATNSSSDTTYLKLYNAGENVGNIDFENGNGSLARITGTKAGTGASANDGILTFSTALDAVITERMRIGFRRVSFNRKNDSY